MEHLHSLGIWALSIAVMLLGFGFVIFWHELGHFLGARWAGIRVEQFAVGMGHAIVSYRKGIGLRRGNTMKEFDGRIDAEIARRQAAGSMVGVLPQDVPLAERYAIAEQLGMSETEYRLSWLPIGGYVKPTGQDDLRPANLAASDDPKSYAAAPVGKRMVMISAGVIMNVILAAILFFVLFRFVGFKSQAPVVGQIQSESPAAIAGLKAGDELLELNGHTLHDFTKILMNVALLPDNEPVELRFRRGDIEQTIEMQARKTKDNAGMLAMGFSPAPLLRAIDPKQLEKPLTDEEQRLAVIHPGETITAVNGKPVTEKDYGVFDAALQQSFGEPVQLTFHDRQMNADRTATIDPVFMTGFDRHPLSMLGTCPRTRVESLSKDSSATDKLKPGDIILSMKPASADEPILLPTVETFVQTTRAAGKAKEPIAFIVQRDGQEVNVGDILPSTDLGNHERGLGVVPTYDVTHLVTAGGDGRIAPGTTITSLAGQPVATWFDVHRALSMISDPTEVQLGVVGPDGKTGTQTLKLGHDDLTEAHAIRYTHNIPPIMLEEWTRERKTENAFTAIGWGVSETRDLILQGYLTIRRVFGGSVPASNMSGPVGIFQAGTKFAQRGTDWFIWFLAVISANLAVVNFLPVPILDGWHFLSLVKEKITGRPLGERVQEIAQYVGLAMILSLIVFVTYNDLARMF